jgi:hypothetical protein
MNAIEELLQRKSSGSGLGKRDYGRKDPPRWPRDTFYPQKLALTSPTSGRRSVDIVRFLTKATELLLLGVNLQWTSSGEFNTGPTSNVNQMRQELKRNLAFPSNKLIFKIIVTTPLTPSWEAGNPLGGP